MVDLENLRVPFPPKRNVKKPVGSGSYRYIVVHMVALLVATNPKA